MRLALWQGAGAAGDLAGTVAEVARVVEAAEDADLVVFPEGFLTGYHLPDLVPGGLSGTEDALREVAAIAARARAAVVMGTHLEADGHLVNAGVVFAPSGEEVGRYRKRALFGPWEKRTFVPGRAGLRFRCAGFTVGLAICYDVEFPEIVRAEAIAGVDLLVVPTALMAPFDHIATRLVPARALENQIHLAYCNRTGSEHGLTYVGLSRICGPRGELLAEAGHTPALLRADLDAAEGPAARAEGSYLDDLRRIEDLDPIRRDGR
jgi:5-aminopentanamidase